MADYPISNVPRRVQYVNTGVGPYLFNFEILTQTDIAVYRGSTLLTLTTDYTVSINSNGTGSVTLTTAGTGNITIVGARAIQRTSDYTTNGDLFANTLNTDLDSQTIYSQQIAETADRSIKVPVYAPGSTGLTVNPEANKLLGWDSTGANLINIDSSTLATITTYATAYADVFVSNGSTVAYTLTRNPGSLYNLDVSIDGVTQEPVRDYTFSGTTITFTSTIPINARILVKYKEGLPNITADSQDVRYLPAGSSTVRNVQAKLRETVSVKDFGAVGDGATDDTAAIQSAVTAIASTGGSIYFPSGTYLVSNKITIPAITNGLKLHGDGKYNSIIQATVSHNASHIIYNAASTGIAFCLEGLSVLGALSGGSLANATLEVVYSTGRTTVRDSEIGYGRTGLNIQGGTTSHVSNCYLHDNTLENLKLGVGDSTVEYSNFETCGPIPKNSTSWDGTDTTNGTHVNINQSGNVMFFKNVFGGCNVSAFLIQYQSQGISGQIQILDNQFDHCRVWVKSTSSGVTDFSLYTQNIIFTGNSGYGINQTYGNLTSDYPDCTRWFDVTTMQDLFIEGNLFAGLDVGGIGFNMSYISNLQLKNNTFTRVFNGIDSPVSGSLAYLSFVRLSQVSGNRGNVGFGTSTYPLMTLDNVTETQIYNNQISGTNTGFTRTGTNTKLYFGENNFSNDVSGPLLVSQNLNNYPLTNYPILKSVASISAGNVDIVYNTNVLIGTIVVPRADISNRSSLGGKFNFNVYCVVSTPDFFRQAAYTFTVYVDRYLSGTTAAVASAITEYDARSQWSSEAVTLTVVDGGSDADSDTVEVYFKTTPPSNSSYRIRSVVEYSAWGDTYIQ